MNFTKVKFCTLIFFTTGMLLFSCKETKDIAYLQPASGNLVKQVLVGDDNKHKTYETRIKPNDLLSISVVSSEQDASKSYNLIVPQISEASTTSLYLTPTMQPYLVDIEGFIDFPVIGKIKISGLTIEELKVLLKSKISHDFNNDDSPIITVRCLNFVVNVLGEVNKPGRYAVDGERITIFEALAYAGDMTIYGQRNNVKVLREHTDGSREIIPVNLNDRNILNNPAYYLEQNDVVYIEPNKVKSRSSKIGSAESLRVSVVSVLISLSTLIINIVK
jgi:polysaccharide biosynthesis/export protein